MYHINYKEKMILAIAAVLVLTMLSLAASPNGRVVQDGKVSLVIVGDDCGDGAFRCSGELLQQCDNGRWLNSQVCTNGCVNSACVINTFCTENAYQCLNDYTQKCKNGAWINQDLCANGCTDGLCNVGSQCQTDEYRCLNEYLQSCKLGSWFNTARCKEGCNKGTCVEYLRARTCTDTDGQDYNTKGTVSGQDEHTDYYTETDYCLTDKDLVEFKCAGSIKVQEQYLCDNGCKNGKCVIEKKEKLPKPINTVIETPKPIIKMPDVEPKGLLTEFWDWLVGIFIR